MFINNEHCNKLNSIMATPLEPYKKPLRLWLPGAPLAEPATPRAADAVLRWTQAGKTTTYIVEHKRHLATQDVRAVAAQLERWLAAAKGPNRRGLLLAPYIRTEQGVVLRERGIDYVDLVGNAHLEAPGVFVHVEGKRPDRDQRPTRTRLTKGWVKTVMALLIRPELLNGPYRPLAEAADVALGTVTACMRDLETRGLLERTRQQRAVADVPDLVALWVQTYGEVLRPKLQVRHFQMRDTEMRARWERLDHVLQTPWALTGADGATIRNDFFRAPETEIYADPERLEDRDALRALVAQPAARQGNLRVIEPPGPLALPRAGEAPHPPTAPLLLIYAELRLRGTDQANEAADMLLPDLLADAQP